MATKPTTKKKPAQAAAARKPMLGSSQGDLQHRLALFIAAHLANGGNATQAAIAAGYSAKTAGMAGNRLMQREEVKQAIAEKQKQLADKFGLTLERTLTEIARLAYADPRRLYNKDGSMKKVHELDDDTAATVASVEVDEMKAGDVVVGLTRKIKQWDKRGALDMAMRFHGAYERDNNQKQTVILQLSSDDEAL